MGNDVAAGRKLGSIYALKNAGVVLPPPECVLPVP